MNCRLNDTITKDFITRKPNGTGISDADSTPTCNVYEDTTATAILSPTCVKRGSLTGNYYVQFAVTTANGFEVGKSYNVKINVVVGGVSDAVIVDSFVVDTPRRPSGLVVTDAGNSATQFKTDRTEVTTDYWKDALCLFVTGSLAGQVKKVTGYNGETKIASFTSGFTGAPSNGDIFELLNF